MLGVLLRWSSTLKAPACKEAARQMLREVTRHVLGDADALWTADLADVAVRRPREVPAADSILVPVVRGLAVLDPLVGRCPWLRGKALEAHLQGGTGLGSFVAPVEGLLQVLQSAPYPAARTLLGSLLCWLATAWERSGWCTAGSSDGLDAPILQGRKRVRRVDPRMKGAVVALVAKEGLAKTGPHGVRLVKRFKHFFKGLTPGAGLAWEQGAARRYLSSAMALSTDADWSTVCVAWDATRLSGQDTVWFARRSPQIPLAAWGPPAVGM
eukprot:2744427-Lingulodinium_polyedra.AAC.1